MSDITILKELTFLINRNRLVIPKLWDTKSKFSLLYEALIDENQFDDSEIAKKLGYEDNQDKAFKKLCSRYEEAVSDLALVIDLRAEERTWMAIEVNHSLKCYIKGLELGNRGNRRLGYHFIDKAYKTSKKFCITNVHYLTLQAKIDHFSTLQQFDKNFYKLEKELKHVKETLEAEMTLTNFKSVMGRYLTVKLTELSKEEINGMIVEIDKLNDKYFSYFLVVRSLVIKTTFLRLLDRFDEIISYSIHVRKLLVDRGLSNVSVKYLSGAIIQTTLITQQKFTEALSFIEDSEDLLTPGGLRFFTQYGKKFICQVRLEDYCGAWQTTKLTLGQKRGLKVFEKYYEEFSVRKAYLQVYNELVGNVLCEDPKEIKKLTKHSFRKLLNELNKIEHDKAGKKTSVIILELIFSIAKNDLDNIINRTESIAQYSYRYLRGQESRKEKLFIQMMLKLPKTNLNQRHIAIHTTNDYEELKSTPHILLKDQIEIEVIPYEVLWDAVVSTFPK